MSLQVQVPQVCDSVRLTRLLARIQLQKPVAASSIGKTGISLNHWKMNTLRRQTAQPLYDSPAFLSVAFIRVNSVFEDTIAPELPAIDNSKGMDDDCRLLWEPWSTRRSPSPTRTERRYLTLVAKVL